MSVEFRKLSSAPAQILERYSPGQGARVLPLQFRHAGKHQDCPISFTVAWPGLSLICSSLSFASLRAHHGGNKGTDRKGQPTVLSSRSFLKFGSSPLISTTWTDNGRGEDFWWKRRGFQRWGFQESGKWVPDRRTLKTGYCRNCIRD